MALVKLNLKCYFYLNSTLISPQLCELGHRPTILSIESFLINIGLHILRYAQNKLCTR